MQAAQYPYCDGGDAYGKGQRAAPAQSPDAVVSGARAGGQKSRKERRSQEGSLSTGLNEREKKERSPVAVVEEDALSARKNTAALTRTPVRGRSRFRARTMPSQRYTLAKEREGRRPLLVVRGRCAVGQAGLGTSGVAKHPGAVASRLRRTPLSAVRTSSSSPVSTPLILIFVSAARAGYYLMV
ncbi:hypothetical protein DFH09DRAFT_1326165 [Mycena vulgaris]|nr:hypothetical protein DFH09DRAFT_1326165 [Mycena vulgaris]